MTKIKYDFGDVTEPTESGLKILAHVVNNVGLWGSGVVVAISNQWHQPEEAYAEWYEDRVNSDCFLGRVQYVVVENDMIVANMCALDYADNDPKVPSIRYGAIGLCLADVAQKAKDQHATVVMPRIGTCRAGGKWEFIEPIIEKTLLAKGVPVTVYDFVEEPRHPAHGQMLGGKSEHYRPSVDHGWIPQTARSPIKQFISHARANMR